MEEEEARLLADAEKTEVHVDIVLKRSVLFPYSHVPPTLQERIKTL